MSATVLLGACNGVVPPSKLAAPELRVTRFQLEDIRGGQARIGLILEAWNPNEIDLPLSQVQFEIRLFGLVVGQGRVDEASFVIPARQGKALPVTLELTNQALSRAVRRGLAERFLGYTDRSSPDPAGKDQAGTGRGAGDRPSDWELQGSLRWGKNPIDLPFRKQGQLDGLGRPSSRTTP
ncbi:MAG: LEA type 2 family protein [Burkholderiaceae bacterium]